MAFVMFQKISVPKEFRSFELSIYYRILKDKNKTQSSFHRDIK